MLRTCAIAGLFLAGSIAQASAATLVQFSTTGVFGASGTNTVTFTDGGFATLTFNGTSNSLLAPTNASFGDILLATSPCTVDAEVCGFSGSASSSFTLNITQTLPTGGTGSLLGQVTGTFAALNSTDFQLTFSSPTTSIDGVTYLLQPFYFIVPPTSGIGGGAIAGTTSLQGQITALQVNPNAPIPEPATMMLLGTGLLAAFRARRKNNAV
jgi:hypothetical protein